MNENFSTTLKVPYLRTFCGNHHQSMGRAPCCDKVGLKRGRWTAEEDEILIDYIKQNGEGSWRSLPKNAGLLRCGKSCRLRWINYLREDLKRGNFTREEEETIIKWHRSVGNRWSLIASNLPGRTDNEIKNYWNSHLRRKIYSFRSCSGSTVSNLDTVKMGNISKRKGGRVSRAFAKKYNMNPISKATTETLASTSSSRSKSRCGSTSGIQEATAAGNAEVGSAEEKGRNYSMTVNERQNINGIDGFNPNRLQGCPWTSVESAEKMEGEREVQGPNGELDDVTLLLDQIFEGGLMDLNEISVHSEETGKKSMDPESTSVNNEGDNCANSHSYTGDLYECFSPLNSCFNHDDSFLWNNEYAFHEFQLWDEQDDLLWP